jgi:hypothetical protein
MPIEKETPALTPRVVPNAACAAAAAAAMPFQDVQRVVIRYRADCRIAQKKFDTTKVSYEQRRDFLNVCSLNVQRELFWQAVISE